ncbi:MAG: N-acetyltransferase family protein [Dehalococcoidia bacterium]
MADQFLPPPVNVRPYSPEDRATVLDLAGRLLIGVAPWLNPDIVLSVVRGSIESAVAAIGPDHTLLVAASDDGCVGFVTVERQQHWAGITQAYIGELVVAETAEGTGAGRALLAAAEDWARARGCATVALDTGAANLRARGFYQHLGYVEESLRLVKPLT